ncbi:MAG TPA: potassium-transporting ATPase subunit KdpC [Nitrococcus sp.]|nr:potassium-transporting ATPase subunit KdpC [Nitrococcus sp.]
MNAKALFDAAVTPNADIRTALRAALVLVILCGGIYPALTTVVGGALFPAQATGSLIFRNGEAIGSALVGQPFKSKRYFYGRPSAAGYRASSMAGSNLAPSNPALRARVRARARSIAALEGITLTQIPVDLVAASGSGIDPHISPAAAAIQIDRVARARGIAPARVRQLVAAYTEPPVLGMLGQPRVHVLRLNLALDRLTGGSEGNGG